MEAKSRKSSLINTHFSAGI